MAGLADLSDDLGCIVGAEVDNRNVRIARNFGQPGPLRLLPDVALREGLAGGPGGEELVRHAMR